MEVLQVRTDILIGYCKNIILTIAGVDFDSTLLTASIPAGQNSTTVIVPILQDNMVEQNEMFFLELELPVAIPGVTLASARMATGTIVDSTGMNT